MYENFFGLKERPFDLSPNPRFLYVTGPQREALANLRYGLTTPRGLTLLLGEAGTGKTTLVQAALGELDADRIECVLLSNPTLTRVEFYEFLSTAFRLDPDTASSKTRFLFALRRHLEERHRAGKLTALVLDEAQSLPYELLEEVRLLGNIETPTSKLLNVVLAAQPELADRLNESSLRQLKQRISLRCELPTFDFPETAAYVAGRLRIAGGRPSDIFSREAVSAIYEASTGVPRTINVVCDNVLIGGFARQVKPITRALVRDVMNEFDLGVRTSTDAAPGQAAKNGGGESADAPLPVDSNPLDEAAVASGGSLFGVFNRRRFSFF
jgi:general secretion pathway protein A